MRARLGWGIVTAFVLAVLASPAQAFRTPFGDQVYEAIERGLAYLRTQENDGSIGGETTPLAGLAIMELRASAHWGAPAKGYQGSTADDQQRLQRMARWVLTNINGLRNGTADSYRTGSGLLFLSLYRQTGGPNDVGAARTVDEGIASGVAALQGSQSQGNCSEGGWNYNAPGTDGDLSTTQYAVAGLSAASGVVAGAANTLPNVTVFLGGATNGDGGLKYRGCRNYASASAMTAAGLWVYRLAGVQVPDDRVQAAMRWLRDNYRYDGHVISNWNQSYYYYLWAASKALEVSVAPEDAAAGLVYEEHIGGQRDPAADGFAEEPQGWYYDFAWQLLQLQGQQGNWPCAGNRGCWRPLAATPYAILVLQRSLGGVCGDEFGDRDGVCQPDDNCPDVPNPDQADADGDGVGDACDLCPNAADPGQEDDDGDGLGNACDDYFCIPQGPEICNGLDDDCDRGFDEGNPGADEACISQSPGICGPGHTECIAGALECVPTERPQLEICDGLDNDCDGTVDDGNPGGFRRCDTGLEGACAEGQTQCQGGEITCRGRVEPGIEICDGVDNDCDGSTDEGNPEGGQACNTEQPGACDSGQTQCVNGGLICVRRVDPGPELCNALDDDCDGQTDEGNPGAEADCVVPGQVGACARGTTTCDEGALRCLPTVAPGQEIEICDGVDNDCDGRLDENVVSPQPGVIPEVGEACQTACGGGVVVCRLGQLRCDGPEEGVPEFCDGSDNDCDGVVDEDSPGQGQDCQTGRDGACAAGRTACVAGGLTCVGVVDPEQQAEEPEACNAQDDDCDGETDEGNPGGGADCLTCQSGVCATGITACINGRVACRPDADPTPEVCDGQDNNCNGEVDELNPGGGLPCQTGLPGQCARGLLNCRAGELLCEPDNVAVDEACNGTDDDCDGQVDEDNPGGGDRCDTGERGVCAVGELACQGGALACVAQARPSVEVCDGEDNDCDGLTDEGDERLGDRCETGEPGICSGGAYRCRAGNLECDADNRPAVEDCNGSDDDCDGQTDEGNPGGGRACNIPDVAGVCGIGQTTCVDGLIECGEGPQPGEELCDALDNDCDGTADEENPGAGGDCDTGFFGLCATGTLRCEGGGLFCASVVEPAEDVCDGLDNDCDGVADEGEWGVASCATGATGVCAEGILNCTEGAVSCDALNAAGPEFCDEIDNDCDGAVDEFLRNACGVCGRVAEEICDGEDNDCDGQVDEGQLCGDQICVRGQCAAPCEVGECVGPNQGRLCVEGGCLEPCDAIDCPAGQACEDGACVDPCANVACAAGQVCREGLCVGDNCYEAGCPEPGQLCLNGACIADPCEAVDCLPHQFCRVVEGAAECVDSCAQVACPFGQRCLSGECVDDPCGRVQCADGELCREGACAPDDCLGIVCGAGRLCIRGRCIDDPCVPVDCPDGEICEAVDGQAECRPGWGDTNPGDAGPQGPPVDMGPNPDDGVAPDMAAVDAGVMADQGVDAAPADMRVTDMAVPAMDRGVTVDSAVDSDSGMPGGGSAEEGCACDSADGGSPGSGLFLVLVLMGWRRRRLDSAKAPR